GRGHSVEAGPGLSGHAPPDAELGSAEVRGGQGMSIYGPPMKNGPPKTLFACLLGPLGIANPAPAAMGRPQVGFDAHLPSPAILDQIRDSGAKWARIDNNWLNQGEPCSDNIRFEWALDDVVRNAIARNVRIYMTLAYTPPCASLGNTDDRQINDI